MAGLDKVAVVGAGSVGAAIAYASVIGRVADEIALFDVDDARARAEVLDLRHGLQFVGGGHVSGGGDVAVCRDADLVVITAGAKQEPGQSRTGAGLGQRRADPSGAATDPRGGAGGHRAGGDQPGRCRHLRGPGDQRARRRTG